MRVIAFQSLACPVDGDALRVVDKALVCKRGHSFDLAGSGYANLLLSSQKSSRSPGDPKEMVEARWRVLNAGLFQPLADTLSRCFLDCLDSHRDVDRVVVLDAGCGEGYYLRRLLATAQACRHPGTVEFAGMDISKWAIRRAARPPSEITWIVATNRYPPILDGTVDLITSLFSFPVFEAFWAIQKTGGRLILVDPGPEHLVELRSAVYPSVRKSGPPGLQAALVHGYALIDTESLTYLYHLDSSEQVHDVLRMTPHHYRIPKAGRVAVQSLSDMDVTVDVRIRTLSLEAAT